jgi:protein arginine kinase
MGKGSDAIIIHGKDRPWNKNDNLIWLASTVCLYRNIEKFSFPVKLDLTRQKQIVSLISKELLKEKHLKDPLLLKVEDMSPVEKQLIAEHFLTPYNLHQLHSGEAFILDSKGVFLAGLNLENHIQLELMDTKGELESTWNHLVKIETTLGKKFNYCFSPRFGFLTADPKDAGTGFVLSVFLQPSALIHTNKLTEALHRLSNDRLTFTGMLGNKEDFIGDVLIAKNNYTLGVSEEEIISTLRLFTTKLLVEEGSARSQIKHTENPELMDKVSRAFGILAHSYKIETRETLNEIGLVKLGVDLGWVEGITPAELNYLLFHCRRAHLLTSLNEPEIPQEQIPHKRAEFIHETLKNAKLKI